MQFEALVFNVFRFEKNKGTDNFQKKIAAQISQGFVWNQFMY